MSVRRGSEYYANGTLKREQFPETKDKPSTISYYEDGTVHFEIYRLNGEIHRDGDQPAKIEYKKDSTVHSFFKNGKPFGSMDKADTIAYSKEGKILWVSFLDEKDCTKSKTVEYLEDGRELHLWCNNGKYSREYVDTCVQLTKACRD